MKYLITENQFDKVVFKYLNNQDFIEIKMGNNIYFVNHEHDVYAQIRYHFIARYCTIHYNLVDEIGKFFSLDTYDCISVINRWVENKFGRKSTNSEVASPIVGY
jgi:hypothetical protein